MYALLDKYTSLRASEGVHQSACWCASPVVGSHFGRPCCALHGSGRVCVITGHTSGLRRPSPWLQTSSGGLGLSPGALMHPDGIRGILGSAGYVWATALRPDPPKNGPVPHSYAGGVYVKYQCINQRDIIPCDTICVVGG